MAYSAIDISEGVALNHQVYGEDGGSGTPIILLHGMFASKDTWTTIIDHFSKDRKVIAVDCRNHGASPWADNMNYDLMAKDVELLMEKLGMDKAVLIGHSMGGKVAMNLALNKPALVEKLILEDIAPEVGGSVEASSHILFIIRQMQGIEFDHSLTQDQMTETMLDQHFKMMPESAKNMVKNNLVKEKDRFRWKMNLDSLLNHIKEMMAFPDRDLTYTEKALFIGGSNSPIMGEKQREDILRFFPQADMHHIEGAGHLVHVEKPEDFCKLVTAFLNE